MNAMRRTAELGALKSLLTEALAEAMIAQSSQPRPMAEECAPTEEPFRDEKVYFTWKARSYLPEAGSLKPVQARIALVATANVAVGDYLVLGVQGEELVPRSTFEETYYCTEYAARTWRDLAYLIRCCEKQGSCLFGWRRFEVESPNSSWAFNSGASEWACIKAYLLSRRHCRSVVLEQRPPLVVRPNSSCYEVYDQIAIIFNA